MKFTYSCGDRPLEGYVIKRGIGRGGFGEVYYGLSDGGKEVALKLVRGNLDIELRGMSQCLNLKHPNLVSLFDMRVDAHGEHWVIMEYVAGEPLNVILSRHPHGLAPELARQWFLGLAAAIGYLHEHGIVHRDLKPGNVFIENGAVKVGDYGLSKFISGSQRTAQTQSVGTVHYMAPEISTGNYNKQIDIYAAGSLLYEMLTGHVPFDGESAGEILMKHLTTPPDLSRVPAEFAPIVAKALAKDPARRHRSMAELGREIEATCQPASLPGGARRASEGLAGASGSRRETLPPTPPTAPIPMALPAQTTRERLVELCGSLVLSVLLAGLFCVLWAAVLRTNDLQTIGTYFFLTVAGCWAVLVPSKLWLRRVQDSLGRRLVLMSLGLLVGLEALWLDGHELSVLLSAQPQAVATPPPGAAGPMGGHWPFHRWAQPDVPVAACYLSYFGLAFFVLRWWKLTERRRPKRFSLFAVLAAAFWGLVLFVLWPGSQATVGVVTLVMAAVIVQLVSPWEPAPPPPPRKLRLPYA
jgi:hypothetical protein